MLISFTPEVFLPIMDISFTDIFMDNALVGYQHNFPAVVYQLGANQIACFVYNLITSHTFAATVLQLNSSIGVRLP